MNTKIHHWQAIGRSVFDLQGGRSPSGLFNVRIAQASKNAPPETAQLIALAPAMAHALSCAARGDCGPARAILQTIPSTYRSHPHA
jgi:hypothetical protein